MNGIANMDGIDFDDMAKKAGLEPPPGAGINLPDGVSTNLQTNPDDAGEEIRSPVNTDDDSNGSKTIVHDSAKTAKEATENEIRDSFNELDKMEVAKLFGSIIKDFCKKIDNKETMEPFIEAFFKKINEHFYSDEAEKKKFAKELLYGIVNNKTLDNKKDTTVGGAADAATAVAKNTDAKNTATAIAVAKDTTDAAAADDTKNTDNDDDDDDAKSDDDDDDAKTTAADDTESDDDDNTVKNEIDKDKKPNAENVLAFLKKEISSLLKGAKPIGDDGKTTPNDRVRQIMQNKIDYILYDTIIKKVEKHLNTMNNPREIFFGEDGIGKVISIEHNEQRLTDLKRILNIQLMCNKSIINVEQLNSMELDEYEKKEGFKEFIHAIQLPESSNDGEKTENSEESENNEETNIGKESESSNDGDKTENNEETKSKKETISSEETKIVKELLETLSELYDVAAHLYELNDEKRDNKNDYILERLNLKNVSDSEINGFLADVFKAIQEFFNINSEITGDNTDDGKTGENNPGNNTTTGGSSRKKKMRKTKKIKSKSKRRTR